MGIKLTIEVESPLSPDDRELLSGLSIMTMAIANHELPGREEQPEKEQPEEESTKAAPVSPCGFLDPTTEGRICVGVLGHRGRHRFREPSPAALLAN